MPDDTNPVPPKSGRINVQQANVTRAKVSDATFTRADIQTGEIKSAEGDILSEIRNAVTDQTETLKSSFEKAIDACCDRIVKAGGAGGGGAGGGIADQKVISALDDINSAVRALAPQLGGAGGDGADPGTVAQTRRVQALSNAIEELGFITDETGDVIDFQLLSSLRKFEEQLRENVNETVREFNATLIKAIGSFTQWSSFSEEVFSRWNKGLDLASSGMADFNTMFWDDTMKVFSLGMSATGDSLMRTAEQIRGLADEITSPMRLVQGNVADVAREFNRLRDEAEDFGMDLYARIGFEEQNKLLTTLIDEQRRGSIQADFRNFETRQLAMQQLDFMGMVADNTGKSLDAILQQHKEQAKTFEELQALGIITEGEAASFKMMANAFPQQAGFLQKIAASGGDMSVFARKFPDLFQDLQALGASDIVSEIGNLSKSGVTGNELANQLMSIMQGGLGDASQRFGSAAAAIMFEGRDVQGLIGATNQMAQFQKDIGEKSSFVRAWNKVSDTLTNTWPVQWAKSIGALTFNTIAIIANTAAHWKSSGILAGAWKGVKGLFGGLGRVLGMGVTATTATTAPAVTAGAGIMSKIGPALGALGKTAGAVGGAAMVGKDVFDLAMGDTSAGNTGALIGSAIGGAIGLIGGPGGALLGAGLGNMAGQWIGEKYGGGAQATAKNPSMAPRGSAGASRPSGGGQMMAMHMQRQTEILGSISAKMDRSIAVQGDIASGISKIGFETRMTVGGKRAGTTGAPLFAESPPMSK